MWVKNIFTILWCFLIHIAIAQQTVFRPEQQPAAPDYSIEKYWSALPFRTDAADKIPDTEQWVNDSLKNVDVFYIYPTIYMSGKTWNANLENKKLNKRIDDKPVRYQASVFNESCRVYAPRYRQAIINAFYGEEGKKSLEFAYQDVKTAFECYLKNYNQNRPFIIASHSQGTYHARKLLQEMIDTTALRNRMVAAYIIGYGIDTAMYITLKPCENETQTNCYITWASFKYGINPTVKALYGNICINPLTWKTNSATAEKACSKGAILLDFNKQYEKQVCTEVHEGYLWVKTNIPVISGWTNLHVADYNLFWYDIRANVKTRINEFLKK